MRTMLLVVVFLVFISNLVSGNGSCSNCGTNDCIGAWTDWSACTLQCGGGTCIRTFEWTKPAIGDGQACAFANGQSDIQSCNTQPCPADCVGQWSAWSGCSVLCGGGTATRAYHIVSPAVGTGTCPCTEGQVDTKTCNTQTCSVDCVGSWGAWSGCSKPCGTGVNTRSYKVVSAAIAGGAACPFADGHSDSLPCNTQVCPINCVGSWSAWSTCSKTCGGGQSTRTFTITTPAVGTGTACTAVNGQTDTLPCNAQLCPVNCAGAWSAWSACSVQCGGGSSTRAFVITTHAVGAGTPCQFTDNQQEVQACNAELCPVNCVGAWSSWSDCNVDCGTGSSTRTFFISTPAIGTGTPCTATHGQSQTQTCNTQPCPVGCVGGWSAWSACSCDCGGGVSTRSFAITTPSVGSGSPCLGANGQQETQQCNMAPCSVDCVGSWSSWSNCSAQCGGGSNSRMFTITKTAIGSGTACSFQDHQVQTQQCNTDACAVDCVGVWSGWSACSVQCGGGSSIRVFTIITPAAGAGALCTANQNQTQAQACNTQACPTTTTPTEDCIGSWSAWSACTQTCGSGSRVRTFSITQQAQNGGKACDDTDGQYEINQCNTQPCPQDCCGEWSAWSSCSVSCGGGVLTRSFHITLPAVAGGKPCDSTEGQTQSQTCNSQPCPVNCVGGWTSWSECSVQCGGGVTSRSFNITTPVVGAGTPCLGASGQTDTLTCNTAPCPVDCVGAWSAWGNCNAPCGGGNSTRKFRITTPAVGTGTQCPFEECEKQTQTCNTDLCPVDCVGHYSDWTACSAQCGGGVSTRTFIVTTPAVGTGAACCSTDGHVDTVTCNTQPCPVNCVGAWSDWSQCSCACGGGVTTRTFNITTPVVGGGVPCLGADGQSESLSCNSQLCAKDCVGAWSSWTSCSVPCGGGASSRTYHVVSPAVGGGADCPIDDLETQCVPCNAVACPASSSGPVVGGGGGGASSSAKAQTPSSSAKAYASSATPSSSAKAYASSATSTGSAGGASSSAKAQLHSSTAPSVGGGGSTGGSAQCAWEWVCAPEGMDNLHGVPQCCYEYKCGGQTGSGSQPQCGWKASCSGELSENSENINCEWSWYCPTSVNTPPSCGWRWLCSMSGSSGDCECNFDFYCGDSTGNSSGSAAASSTATTTPELNSTAPTGNDQQTGGSSGDDYGTGSVQFSHLNSGEHTTMSTITLLALLCVSIMLAL